MADTAGGVGRMGWGLAAGRGAIAGASGADDRPTAAAGTGPTAAAGTGSTRRLTAGTDVGRPRSASATPPAEPRATVAPTIAGTGPRTRVAGTGGRSQWLGTALVRVVTPATASARRHGVATSPGPTGSATRRPREEPTVAGGPACTGTATTRRPEAPIAVTSRAGAGMPPVRMRARSDSLNGDMPGDQATGAVGATIGGVARVQVDNDRIPRHVAERGVPKVLHLVLR